jgi:hypothetical protein
MMKHRLTFFPHQLWEVCPNLHILDVTNCSNITCRGLARLVTKWREDSDCQRKLEKVRIEEPNKYTWGIKVCIAIWTHPVNLLVLTA